MSMAEASIDPLAHFFQAVFRRDEKKPVPLIATHIDVAIRGGLGFVTTQRTFRNTEKISIEATMTFPVPVDATLCALTANIDGAVLHAVARARNKAAKTYEAAVINGKSAILHRELLKGIHMLSVGHVRPGGDIIVTDTWTAPLSFLEQTPRLRIPTTVGEIYGRSPLAPPDDLVSSGTTHEATVSITCNDGTASLLNTGPMVDGRYRVMLDAPIDIVVSGWTARKLTGVAADGRQVVLDIAPAPAVEANLDIDVLFDHSGSMSGPATGYCELNASKFDLAKAGLIAAIRHHLRPADRMRLWQFDDSVDYLGEANGADCAALVGTVDGPRGGTEIGRAFDVVVAAGQRSGLARNVVIVTDGLSWALDPEKLARTGVRVTAVLIGEDASEAAIGHLAGLTGGQVFAAVGSDAGGAIAAALDAARMPRRQPETLPDKPRSVEVFCRGARVMATWGSKGEGHPSSNARQIGASAAMLAIPFMNEDAAAALAEAEGVVCHLTSLVLVDEAGGRYERLPATRKVELSTPRVAAARDMGVACALIRPLGARAHDAFAEERRRAMAERAEERRCCEVEGRARMEARRAPAPCIPARPQRTASLREFVGRIDWDADPEALRHGDMTGLPFGVEAAITRAAGLPEIVALARKLKVDPALVVIGLLARASRGYSRSAGRLANALIGRLSADEIATAVACVGL
jgi:predicted DCC family thiol-disulfide oxidoreductase YuxK